MIHRYMFVKLADGAEGVEQREALAQSIGHALREDKALSGVRVGLPADEMATRAWDLSIEVWTESRADMREWTQAEVCRDIESVRLGARAIVVKGWAFEAVEEGESLA